MAFGGHLIGEEFEGAVGDVSAVVGAEVTDFTVGALFPMTGEQRGGHLFIVEFSGPV